MPTSFAVRKARELLREGDAPSAARLLEQWLDDQPGDTRARDYLAAAYYEMGALEDAEELLRWVVREWPQKARCRANLAMVLRKLGRLDEAYAVAEAALRLDPDHKAARRELARIKRLMRLPTCGYCLMPVEPAEDYICPACGWHYHEDCWAQAGACENRACGSSVASAGPQPRPKAQPARSGCLATMALGLVLIALPTALRLLARG